MAANTLFETYRIKSAESNHEIYRLIAETVGESALAAEEVVEAFLKRERIGDLQIAPQVLLPHFESGHLSKSKVIVIQMEENIQQWSNQLSDIRLVIAILMRTDEESEVKKVIIQLMRKLADDTFIERLLQANTEIELSTVLDSIKEEEQ